MLGYVRERLDQALANMEWRTKFVTIHVLNGDPRHSDHRPIIILTERKEVESGRRAKAFFFEAARLEEEQCMDVMKEGWEQGVAEGLTGVDQLVGKVAGSLAGFECVGCVGEKKKKLKKELESCRRGSLSEETVSREAVLRFQLDKVEE